MKVFDGFPRMYLHLERVDMSAIPRSPLVPAIRKVELLIFVSPPLLGIPIDGASVHRACAC